MSLIKTDAIVLHLGKVNDRTMVLHLYTRTHGRVSYFIYGTGGRSRRLAMLQPLNILSIEATHNPADEPIRLNSFTLAYTPVNIPFDMTRRTVALFMAEVLFHTLTHPLQDTEIFDFIVASIHQLDTCSDAENEHLRFLIGLCERLGFGIDFQHVNCAPLRDFMFGTAALSRSDRQVIVRWLIDYLRMNIDGFNTPKSLDVLTDIYT